MGFATAISNKRLCCKVLKVLKLQIEDLKKEDEMSKLYTIFQAWKFHVKESSLLKKYMSQADLIKSQNNELKCPVDFGKELNTSMNDRVLSEMNSKDVITDQDSSYPEETIEHQSTSPFNIGAHSF